MTTSGKRAWRKPQVRVIEAGAAEGSFSTSTCDNSGNGCGGGNYRS